MTSTSRYNDLDGTNLIAESNYTFDEAGRLTNLIHLQDATTLAAFAWVYDAANRITQYTSPDGTSDYNYDDTDQLLDADRDFQADENYRYDENGNRTNPGYVTGENNQLLSDRYYSYEYDGEGNRVSRTEIATGEVTEYQWDYRNRLVGTVTSDVDGNVIALNGYTYDVFDRRIAKSVDSDGDGAEEDVVERFVHDGDHIALTFDGDGNETERFLHGVRIDEVLAQENAGGEVLWAIADHQGSVRLLMDNQGNVVNNITYDSFGNVTVETNAGTSFRFGYTGREFDEETGNYYYRSRFLDPLTGRFIQEDKIGFDGGDTNLSRYVGNNPLFLIDPSGFCGVSPFGQPKINSGEPEILVAGIGGAVDLGKLLTGAWELGAATVGAIGTLVTFYPKLFNADRTNVNQIGDFNFDDLSVFDDINLVEPKLLDALTVGHPGEFDPNRLGELPGVELPSDLFDGFPGSTSKGLGDLSRLLPFPDGENRSFFDDFEFFPSEIGDFQHFLEASKGSRHGRGGNRSHKDKDIFLGEGFVTKSSVFHEGKNIKKKILKKVGRDKFEGEVGSNPDVKIVNGKIVLTGTKSSPFQGKSFPTQIPANDFFNK